MRTPFGSRSPKWTAGTEVVMERNDAWVGGKTPAIKRVIWRMVPSAGNRRALLERGDADISYELPNKDFVELKDAGKLNIISTPYSNGIQYIGMNVTQPPFDNIKVRQAVAYALPYQEIMDAVVFAYRKLGRTTPTTAEPAPLPDFDRFLAGLRHQRPPDILRAVAWTILAFAINYGQGYLLGRPGAADAVAPGVAGRGGRAALGRGGHPHGAALGRGAADRRRARPVRQTAEGRGGQRLQCAAHVDEPAHRAVGRPPPAERHRRRRQRRQRDLRLRRPGPRSDSDFGRVHGCSRVEAAGVRLARGEIVVQHALCHAAHQREAVTRQP